MFVSANFLGFQYGTDDRIAKFFADREPPKDNLYWKDKLLYLRPEPGWIFIPLAVDLLFKSGIERVQLLSEQFVGLMEQVGHISALEETKQVSGAEAIDRCIQLVKDQYQNESYYNNIISYFKGEANPFAALATPYKALHRGDLFLFSLCALRFSNDLQNELVTQWFALISTLLLLDDADDIDIDRTSGDPNAFLEAGLTPGGIQAIKNLISQNLQTIAMKNKVMATTLDKKLLVLKNRPELQKLLLNG